MGNVRVYDNGGESYDRYTVIIGSSGYGMSDTPIHPMGFNQYIGEVNEDFHEGDHLGQLLDSIPPNISEAVQARAS